MDLFGPGPAAAPRGFDEDPLAGAFADGPPPAPARTASPMGGRAEGAPHLAALPPVSRSPRAVSVDQVSADRVRRRGRPGPLRLRCRTGAGTGGPAETAGPPAAATAAVAALAAFLEGAGLEPDIATGRAPEAALREAGALFAALAGGLRDLLAMRAAMKDHAGLDRTQITAALNNPLKLSVTRREATASLLGPPEEGYLVPRAAVEAAFRDLTAHELGLFDGVQSAVEELPGPVRAADPGTAAGGCRAAGDADAGRAACHALATLPRALRRDRRCRPLALYGSVG